jgi:hypothetical protein
MFKPSYTLMMAADGEGSDAGGAVDRGDEIDAAAAAEAVDENAAEEPDAVEAAEAAKAEALGKPRDENGKFTKKEKEEGNRIPKERFDEAVGKERAAREAAEARAAAAEARVKQEEKAADQGKYDAYIEDLEKQHSKLLLDGESEKASGVMKQIRMAERELARMESDSNIAQATSKAVEQVRWDAAVATLEAAHPMLNPDSEEYDQDMTDIVIAEQHRLMQTQNMPASKALLTAANKIVVKFGKASTDGVKAAGLSAAKPGDRKAEQVAKNLAASKAQPGSMKATGRDSDKGGNLEHDGKNITKAELDAMPEATKARLRGDFL